MSTTAYHTPGGAGSDTSQDIIIQEQTAEPNVSNNYDYRPIEGINIYTFMSDAYYGSGGFRDGRYLVPHTREMFYPDRRSQAYYKNYVAPIVRAMIDPVFNDEIERGAYVGETQIDSGLFVNGFIEDCDNAGKTLQEFTREAVALSRLHGVTFIVMDNYRAEEMPEAKGAALDERKFPYVYFRTADQVEKWETDKFGNLLWIIFVADPEEEINPVTKKPEKRERWERWDDMTWQKLGKNAKGELVVLEEYVHGLGVIPVIAVYSTTKRDPKNILVDPPVYDIAKINHAIFNKDSEVRDQERAQGFSVFYIQADDAGATSIGTHNFIQVPIEASITPGYTSPDSSILSGLVDNGEKLREDLFRIAGQNGVVGVQDSKSGIAKQWDFLAHEIVLKKTSKIATWTEEQIIALFQAYTGETFEYRVIYPSDFQPQDHIIMLDTIQATIDMGLPPKAHAQLKESAYVAIASALGFEKNDIAEAQEEFEPEREEIIPDTETDEPDTAETTEIAPQDDKAELLNGAQISSMVEVVKAVAVKELPRESGIEILVISFNINRDVAERIIPQNIAAQTDVSLIESQKLKGTKKTEAAPPEEEEPDADNSIA